MVGDTLRSYGKNALVALILAAGGSAPAKEAPTTKPWIDEGSKDVRWKTVEPLVKSQKLEAALKEIAIILKEAEAKGSIRDWTEALVKRAQLRIALHGYETAVGELRKATWPTDQVARGMLSLYLAHTLMTYNQAYGYEIRTRERHEGGAEDLKQWTVDDIAVAIHQAFASVWKERARFDEVSDDFFAPALVHGTYPREIRPTIRDSLSYLWASFLADTSLWRPAESNELFRLDPFVLTGSDVAGVAVDDLKAHPLVRAARVLSDLEAWHKNAGRRGAALEAYLTRTRTLHNAFSGAKERSVIRAALEDHLSRDANNEWWAMGAAQLAQFHITNDAADSRIVARDWLLKGLKAAPKGSVGAVTCAALLGEIEAPQVSLEAMDHDGLARRSILIHYRNLSTLYLRAYRLNDATLFGQRFDYSLLFSTEEMKTLLPQKPDAAWQETLAPTQDFRDHNHFVKLPVKSHGVYVVLASVQPDFMTKQKNQVLGTTLFQTDIILARVVTSGTGMVVRVLDGATGAPVTGAEVTLMERSFEKKKNVVITTKPSTQDGLASFDKPFSRNYPQYFITARKGDNLALMHNNIYFTDETKPNSTTNHLLYTDRSVYRPGQTLHFKLIAYKGVTGSGRFHVASGEKVTITLKDANNQKIASVAATTNDFGSAAGTFALPATGRLLGQWRLETQFGSSTVRIEEYKRPTLDGTWPEHKQALRLNAKARIDGQVNYYFGLPVAKGSVRWTVTREPNLPVWWFWCFGDFLFSPSSRTQQVASGTTALKDGAFAVEFTPEANAKPDEAERAVTFDYAIVADVVSEDGETLTMRRRLTIGYVDVQAQIAADGVLLAADKPTNLSIKRLSLRGEPRPGSGGWHIVALKQPAQPLMPADELLAPFAKSNAYELPQDRMKPRWRSDVNWRATAMQWPAAKTLAEGSVTHDERGNGDAALPPLPAGIYRLVYSTKDSTGQEVALNYEFVVAGMKPLDAALPLLAIADRNEARPGDTVHVLAHTGFKDQTLAVQVYRGSERAQTFTVKAGASAALIAWPVTDADQGGVRFIVSGLRDYQPLQEIISVNVPWITKELKVSLATFRDKLKPGQSETWTIKVAPALKGKGERAAAEVLAYMYDKSLDKIASHTSPNLLAIYRRNDGGGGGDQLQIGVSHAMGFNEWGPLSEIGSIPYLEPTRFALFDGYGYPMGGGPGMRGGFALSGGTRMMMAEADAAPPSAPGAKSYAHSQGGIGTLNSKEIAPETAQQAANNQTENVRSNFAETAFFVPQLAVDAKGEVALTFTVPESVTAWTAWFHALTKDLMAGSFTTEIKTVKELIVRPSLPRFLRENDTAQIRIVVSNASDKPQSGKLTFTVLDPETRAPLNAAFGLPERGYVADFSTKPSGSTDVRITLKVPATTKPVAIHVRGEAAAFSDGEERVLPILPGRMHLTQSRFAAVKGRSARTLELPDMAKTDDPSRSHEQLVVTVDAQLHYGLLNALPFLINSPYESSELALDRFLATGILTSVYQKHPELQTLAKTLASQRKAPLETWSTTDANRHMAIEETPWVFEAKGGAETTREVMNVLAPENSSRTMRASLDTLTRMQLSDGGFPWYPGGPASPFMTLYILAGFARATEFGVEVPRPVVTKGWGFLARYLRETLEKKNDLEFLTYLNYVASSYPDPSWVGEAITAADRAAILAQTFAAWQKLPPRIKLMLALTLHRSGRANDSATILGSVLDSAKTDPDLGTYWAPEDRAWLWYNDTGETQAFALRALSELRPKDPRREGLVQWLFLNKKLNHWSSTRATAEVIYSVMHHLRDAKGLGATEQLVLAIGPRQTTFSFDPARYSGKGNQVVVPGVDLKDSALGRIAATNKGPNLAFVSATWYFATDRVPDKAEGDLFRVTRRYFKRENNGKEFVLKPLDGKSTIAVGEELEVQLAVTARHAAEYVHLRDPRPAGCEPPEQLSRWRWDLGLVRYEEPRDSGTNFFFERLPAGEYTLKYRLRAAVAGEFQAAPATLESLYAPEFAAYSQGRRLTISE